MGKRSVVVPWSKVSVLISFIRDGCGHTDWLLTGVSFSLFICFFDPSFFTRMLPVIVLLEEIFSCL